MLPRMSGRLRGLVLVALVLSPVLARAADVPVGGKRLRLRGGEPGRRSARIVLRDVAIAAPFADPSGGSALVVHAGLGTGDCHARIPLDPARWEPIGRDGPTRGWRYRHPAPGAQGVRQVVVRPGSITVRARHAGWPCDLGGAAQPVPVRVVLETAGTRHCAAFGGDVTANVAGRLDARNAPAPAACLEPDVTVANLNVLHGVFCPPATAACRRVERFALVFQWVVDAGCPDVVTFQEVNGAGGTLLLDHAATACTFAYHVEYVRTNNIDDQMILSRYPILAADRLILHGGFRYVSFARIDHPLAPVDVFSTHLAAGSDGANDPCGVGCPPECVAAGAATVRECQGVQLAEWVAARHDAPGPALVTGDFNAGPGTFVYEQLADRGWIDTYLAAGNPECDDTTGVGCTSGRDDDSLGELESPASNQSQRIDYVFLVAPPQAGACTIDGPADDDGDGSATRIFADDPNPFAPSCGPAPEPICWPSDHEGAELDLNCS
jgi:endonuclease/exonuclease/phosphatase family metal-dependent hydrolase